MASLNKKSIASTSTVLSFFLIQQKRMQDINKKEIKKKIEDAGEDFNLYRFIQNY
jgi:hypothetical protein